MTSQTPILVSEVFTTIQGEGPSMGRHATFIRLWGCSLRCTFCDAAYTWRTSEEWPHEFDDTIYSTKDQCRKMSVRQLLSRVESNRVVITGGEPVLQDRSLRVLFQELRAAKIQIEVETSGISYFRHSGWLVDQFNVSPKLASSGNSPSEAIKDDELRTFVLSGRAHFKFVYRDRTDLIEILNLQSRVGFSNDRIWLMPEGVTIEDLQLRFRECCEFASARGWNVSHRLHILAWGNERGR